MTTSSSSLSGLGHRLGTSISFKLFVVLILMMLFLIPIIPVMILIEDRHDRQDGVVEEIGTQWGGPQTLSGPLLIIPYVPVSSGGTSTLAEAYIYVLPEEVGIQTDLQATNRKRGRFQASVYEGMVQLEGNFRPVDLSKLGLTESQVLWQKARLVVGTGPFKGLKNPPSANFGGQALQLEPTLDGVEVFEHSLSAEIGLTSNFSTIHSFSMSFTLRGSEHLSFMPMAGRTHLEAKGTWDAPKFIGSYLPDTSQITSNAFTAQWDIAHLARQTPSQWTAGPLHFVSTDVLTDQPSSQRAKTEPEVIRQVVMDTFGIEFLQPLNPYQQTERTVKYGILFSMLTFVSLLIAEWIQKKAIHVIQYVWVGCSMIVFFVLLLSFSEQMPFMWAYLLAAVATITLVSVFISTILKSRTWGAVFAGLLCLFYGFMGVLIQLEDTALLVGSIGLFITLGLLMYFSSRIPWEGTFGNQLDKE